jgi:hypothetical protein
MPLKTHKMVRAARENDLFIENSTSGWTLQLIEFIPSSNYLEQK